MAVGLKFLGRGQPRQASRVSYLHLFGALSGGALAGALIAGVGALFMLSSWRTWIIGSAVLLALIFSIVRPGATLGRQRQVPREWAETMSAYQRFLLWGAMLGSGVTTLIPYSAFLILFGAQLTAGIALGAVSGAVFGGTRQLMVVVPQLKGLEPNQLAGLLVRFRTAGKVANAVVAAGGGLVLVLFSAFT